jgi:hypothetical protein
VEKPAGESLKTELLPCKKCGRRGINPLDHSTEQREGRDMSNFAAFLGPSLEGQKEMNHILNCKKKQRQQKQCTSCKHCRRSIGSDLCLFNETYCNNPLLNTCDEWEAANAI